MTNPVRVPTPFSLFIRPSKASFIVGGQYGSEGKGAAAAWIVSEYARMGQRFDIITTNAGAQAGHTSIHDGVKRVAYHLPTAALITQQAFGDADTMTYLNAGSVIDPKLLQDELILTGFKGKLFIHPNAAVITDECKAAETELLSPQTKIASTRKGVGEAVARKVLRWAMVAKDHPYLKYFTRRLDLNSYLDRGKSVLVEVPQGVSLSLNASPFYPHCTSRDCHPGAAMADAGIHPSFYGETMMVLRTYPIRVGNICDDEGKEIGNSGPVYPGQQELSWADLNRPPEITTVTKRVRRVFTFSTEQTRDAMALCRPNIVYVSFCDYLSSPFAFHDIQQIVFEAAALHHIPRPVVIASYGPSTADVRYV